MKVQGERKYLLKIKALIVFAIVMTGTFLFSNNTVNAAAKTYVSSSSKKDCVSATIKDNKLIVKGKTTKKSKQISYVLFYYGNGYSGEGPGEQYVPVKNKSYSFTVNITDRLGKRKDGKYQLNIQNGTQNTIIWISVKNKKATFHETNAYSSDKIATSFLTTLDRKTLLKSVSDDPIASSPSNLNMTAGQKKEIKNKAHEITKNVSGDYNKVKAVYKWITENIYYDEASAKLAKGNGNNNPYVVFKKRYGVCEGYARLMNEMLRSLNIPCVYVGGYAQSYPVTLSTGGGHAWVAVYADKRWFYCDPTWDSTNKYRNGKKVKGKAHDSYFDQSIQAMSVTHRISEMEAKKRVNDFDIVFYNRQVSAGMYQGSKSSITYPSKVGNLKITQLVGVDFSNRDSKKFKTNSKTKTITIPKGYTTMDNWALQYYVGLNKVVTQKSLSKIGKRIAPNSKSTVTFYGEANSAMEKYAKKDGYKFKRL